MTRIVMKFGRHLGGRPGPHPQRGLARGRRRRARRPGGSGRVRHVRRHQPAGRLVPATRPAPRRPRIRLRCRDRRAGHRRPAGDRAAGARPRRPVLARLAGARVHRRRPRPRPHRADRRRPHPGGDGPGPGRRARGLPGRRTGRTHHHARPRRLRHLGGGAGSRTPRRSVRHLHRRRWRLHHRSAYRPASEAPRQDRLRGNARAGFGGCQGAADPLGRARDEGARAGSRAVELCGGHRRPGNAGGGRGRDRGKRDRGGHRLFARRGEDHRPGACPTGPASRRPCSGRWRRPT